MKAATTTVPPAQTPAGVRPDGIELVRVSVPQRTAGSELRAIRIVWRRELIRFRSDPIRIVTWLVQPFLFLFVLGEGLSHIASAGTHGVPLKSFIYPGVLCMAVMFTAMFSAASFVWDREFGFLREMMVAPVSRSSIILGKCLGGATVAALQGLIVLAIAGAAHVPYHPLMLLGAFGIQLLLAFTITAMGMAIAVRIKQMQSFMGLTQLIMLPMFFLSGALFPASGLPAWLNVLTRLDPMSYAVDPMRKLVFANLKHVNPIAKSILVPGLNWWSYHIPSGIEVGVVAAIGVGMMSIAVIGFNRAE